MYGASHPATPAPSAEIKGGATTGPRLRRCKRGTSATLHSRFDRKRCGRFADDQANHHDDTDHQDGGDDHAHRDDHVRRHALQIARGVRPTTHAEEGPEHGAEQAKRVHVRPPLEAKLKLL